MILPMQYSVPRPYVEFSKFPDKTSACYQGGREKRGERIVEQNKGE